MSDGGHVQADLERALASRTERDRLRQQAVSAEATVQQAADRAAELRRRLADETEDVEALESFSWARTWSALKGSHADDLARETAERDAARYAVAEAEARLQAARADLEELRARIAALGDVDSDYDHALAAKEAWLRDDGTEAGRRLATIAERRGALAAEESETREAHDAGRTALDLLRQAQDLLDNARAWSTWDTFGGGGLITDMVKYDRIDKVEVLVHRADVALGRFARELADIGVTGIGGVQVSGLTRTFDVWFDNLFSDLAVRSRIKEAVDQVDGAAAAVTSLLNRLSARLRELASERDRLDAEREELLNR